MARRQRSAGRPASGPRWAWKVGVLVAAGVLSAGCTSGRRAATTIPAQPAGSPTMAASSAAVAGAGSAGAGAQVITTQDQAAQSADDAAIQQDLAQLNTQLSSADQASSQGESDPSN